MCPFRRLKSLLLSLIVCSTQDLKGQEAAPTHEADTAAGIEFFETEIRPLLADACFRCHGERRQLSELRVDSYASILKGGERGPAVVPGDLDASWLIQAVRYEDEDLQMPPKSRLDDVEIQLLEKWVEIGAPGPLPEHDAPDAAAETGKDSFDFEGRKAHWAFQPLQPKALPKVQDSSWPKQDMDYHILHKLEQEDLEPAPPATKNTWIRRVYFDLIGLPPTREEVEAFLSDRSPEASSKVVDELLSSPHFGERWARHWLDLMRYGETKGHEFDYLLPNAYQYRDYLIRAFNADIPYHQFIREHVAGDLLEKPRLNPDKGFNESVLATGSWFLGEEVHSPVDVRLDQTERIANQIDVFSKSFQSLTIACARCHDHKFDAIRAEDYYALSGFLLSSSYRQVRFESMEHNSGIARQLENLQFEFQEELRTPLARALQSNVDEVATYLLGAQEIVHQPSTTKQKKKSLPRHLDLLFADFEGPDYGDWEAEGEAFGKGPLVKTDLPDFFAEIHPRGNRTVNSYATVRNAEGRGSDKPTGRLRSPKFEIRRDFIHFLIGGGNHKDKTCLNLVIDGEIVQSATGNQSNRVFPKSFEVAKFRGRTAYLELVDDHSGSWGQVGLDHVVFSDQPIAEVALRSARSEKDWQGIWIRTQAVARSQKLDAQRLLAWHEALQQARQDPDAFLHAWAIHGDQDNLGNANPAATPEVRVLVDYGQSLADAWLQDGVSFGSGPAQIGDFLWTADKTGILALHTRTSASYASVWDRLQLTQGTQTEASRLEGVRPGRTLRTPSFTLGTGKLYYLVRGSAHVYVPVASHRMNQGPLHGSFLRNIQQEDNQGFRWVEHDLSEYAGEVAHVEFTPKPSQPLGFAVAMVVEADELPIGLETGLETATTNLGPQVDALGASPQQMAAGYQELLTASLAYLQRRAASETYSQEQLASWANWILQRPQLFPALQSAEIVKRLQQFYAARKEITDRIQTHSRTAPALLEGSGVDEFLLKRGSHKSPAQSVPRRFLEAIDGRNPYVGSGSARRQLAASLCDENNPLTARVFVNRVWHHMFGRGLVSTVDNFGITGSAPTHPELLDALATSFMEQGWSLKKLLREIVLSRTYAMSSGETTAGRSQDPKNLWLHRMPIKRLQGEIIRDALLSASGSLDQHLYGPPVAVHLTDFMQGRGKPGNSGPLDGGNRRSIYQEVRRNFLIPFFMVFDFPIPLTTMGRRSVSNVPAQALSLMNDPFVLQQAQRWAAKVLAESKWDDKRRIDQLYWTAFGREPKVSERRSALRFLRSQRRAYEETATDEKVWTDLCHVLINLKEFIYIP